jgi:hypothetical protein
LLVNVVVVALDTELELVLLVHLAGEVNPGGAGNAAAFVPGEP